jgi:glutamate--cysteine ligase
MGPLGYQSDAQASLAVSYNGLDSYGASLQRALTEPYPPYESIGVKVGDEYRQLAATLLQIENEFYGTIRPKRTIRPGERPLHALRERGVEYVEVRCMDVDPFETVGINAATMRMLDVFLLHCLLSESPPDTPEEIDRLKRNQHLAAQHGRDPAMRLERGDGVAPLRDWGEELLAQCAPIAEALDSACGGSAHRDALDSAAGKLSDATRTPSAHVLDLLERAHRRSHVEFALAQSRLHREALTARPLEGEALESQERQARESLAAQRAIEAADRVPFETYRQRYLAQDLLVPANGPAME